MSNSTTGTYATQDELLDAIQDFFVNTVGMTEQDYSADGNGYRLHISDGYMQWNFRSASGESVVDTQSGNLTGIAMNYSTGYNALTDWDKQTDYTEYDTSTNDSVAVFLTITSGTYFLHSDGNDYSITVKDSSDNYQHICFGKLAMQQIKEWFYISGSVSGYIANYATNSKYMLFSDYVAFSGTNYGSLFLYDKTSDEHYNDYDATNIIIAPVDDITASAMDKFQSDIWEYSYNSNKIVPPLNRIHIFKNDSGTYKYVGYIRNVRLLNMSAVESEKELILGRDTFTAYPLHSEDDTYGYRGIAIGGSLLSEDDIDGFITPDGSDDYVTSTVTETLSGNKYTIAMTVMHRSTDTLKGSPDFAAYFSFDSGFVLVYDDGSATFRSTDGSNFADQSLPAGFFVKDDAWHTYIFSADSDIGEMKVIKDNSTVYTRTATTYVKTGITEINWLYRRLAGKGNEGQYKRLCILDKYIGEIGTDSGNYQSGNIEAISDKIQWLKCNEASGNLADSSGNSNTGTPTNTDPTFYNRTSTNIKIRSYYEDFYDKFHIQEDNEYINTITLGNVNATVYKAVVLWNMYFGSDKTFTALNNVGSSGVTIEDDTVPTEIKSLEYQDFELTISKDGVFAVNNIIEWDFSLVNDPYLSFTGTRAYLFAYMPENNISETLSFNTDVIEPYSGKEQRICLRYSPSQKFSYKYFLRNTDYDDFQKIFIENRPAIAIPIWTMHTRSSVNLPQVGDANNILCDTIGRGLAVGDAIIIWDSSTNYEVVTISAKTDTDIDFTETLTGAYTKPYVAPIKRVFIEGITETLYPKHKKGYYEFTYTVLEPLEIDSYSAGLSLNSIPVIYDMNVFQSSTSQNSIVNNQKLLDFKTGTMTVKQFWDKPKKVLSFGWYKNTFADIYELYEFLHYLKGRLKIFYYPTFQGDFELSQDLVANAGEPQVIYVVDNNMRGMFDVSRRNAIYFRSTTGLNLAREVTSIVLHSTGVERISVSSGFFSATPKTILKAGDYMSWLIPYRLESDEVNINWNMHGEIMLNGKIREVDND